MGKDIGIKRQLQDIYLEYLAKRTVEIKEKHLTTRLVIDFRRGVINSIQDQAIIAGISSVDFYSSKLTD